MKKYIVILILSVIGLSSVNAQYSHRIEGTCGEDVQWNFDGNTLTISNVNKKGEMVKMSDYNVGRNIAPWAERKLNVRAIMIKKGIKNIGSCAFANLNNLVEVRFENNDVETIGWGAFMNCSHLRNISIPLQTKSIETIAFANCVSLPSIIIPDRCRLADQAFVSCTNLKMVDVAPTAIIGHHTFANEVIVNGKPRHALYNGEIRRLPSYVNLGNCYEFGFSKESVDKCTNKVKMDEDYDYATSQVDTIIPQGYKVRYDTYALIIGNQNYRFVSDVPYAIHDARTFAEYCKKTFGLPEANVRYYEDASYGNMTAMIQRMKDIADVYEGDASIILYFSGLGVCDEKTKERILLPIDASPAALEQTGIKVNHICEEMGPLNTKLFTFIVDAPFSGKDKTGKPLADNRGVAVSPRSCFTKGNTILCLSQDKGETAYSGKKYGHSIFTYHLLQSMAKHRISGNISEMLKDAVSATKKTVLSEYDKVQDPLFIISPAFGDKRNKITF